jgi:hypothetical protein
MRNLEVKNIQCILANDVGKLIVNNHNTIYSYDIVNDTICEIFSSKENITGITSGEDNQLLVSCGDTIFSFNVVEKTIGFRLSLGNDNVIDSLAYLNNKEIICASRDSVFIIRIKDKKLLVSFKYPSYINSKIYPVNWDQFLLSTSTSVFLHDKRFIGYYPEVQGIQREEE